MGQALRPPLNDALVVRRPYTVIPIWLWAAASPGLTVRDGQWAADLLRPCLWHWGGAQSRVGSSQGRHPPSQLGISVAGHRFIGADAKRLHRHEQAASAAARTFAGPHLGQLGGQAQTVEACCAPATPQELADRIIDLHHGLSHDRRFLRMDLGGVRHSQVLSSPERLGIALVPSRPPTCSVRRPPAWNTPGGYNVGHRQDDTRGMSMQHEHEQHQQDPDHTPSSTMNTAEEDLAVCGGPGCSQSDRRVTAHSSRPLQVLAQCDTGRAIGRPL